MTQLFMFTSPKFSAKVVAKVISMNLGRKLTFQESDELEDMDGCVEVTNRVHIQVGADYLEVCAWKDETTMQCWPARSNFRDAIKDLKAAIVEFPEP